MDQKHQVSGASTAVAGQPNQDDVSLPARVSYCRAAISKDPFYEMLAARKKKVSTLRGL